MTRALSRVRTSLCAALDAMQAKVLRVLSIGSSQSTAELEALPASQWRRSFGLRLQRRDLRGPDPNMSVNSDPLQRRSAPLPRSDYLQRYSAQCSGDIS